MQNSYSSKYLKIYFWQGISVVLNFLSMFIVIPFLTKEPTVYGVYTVCISISIFLSYADLGFIGSGQKYAAECFARGEREKEIRIIGFTTFILFIFVLLCMAAFIYLGINPQLLLKNLDTPNKISIASHLLFILACFAPLTVLQRMSQLVFGIRLEDYVNQRVYCVASAVKIFSVLYFFRNNHYLIVEYFLFSQIVNLLSSSISLLIAKYKYNYNFKLLFCSFRFDIGIYKRVSNLAFSSLFITIMWILFYELDTIAIGKILGAEKVAIYAIGLTILSFFRTIFGVLFSPFYARFNHFIGQNDFEGLKRISFQVVKLTAPIVIFPIVGIVLVLKPFILSWVGENYIESIGIARFLILCNIFAFISYPASMLLMAQEKIKQMYIINAIIPIIFWGGIIFSYSVWGLQSFAIFKLFGFIVPLAFYLHYFLKFIDLSFINFLNKVVKTMIIPLSFLIILLFLLNEYLPCAKSKINLLIVIGTTSIMITGAFIIQYLVSSDIRKNLKLLLNSSR